MAREIDSTRNEKLPRYDLRFMDNQFAERMRRKKQDPFKHRQRRYHKTGDFVVEDIEVPMAVQCSLPFKEYRSDKMEPVFRGDNGDDKYDKYDNGSDTEYDENGFPKFGSLRQLRMKTTTTTTMAKSTPTCSSSSSANNNNDDGESNAVLLHFFIFGNNNNYGAAATTAFLLILFEGSNSSAAAAAAAAIRDSNNHNGKNCGQGNDE